MKMVVCQIGGKEGWLAADKEVANTVGYHLSLINLKTILVQHHDHFTIFIYMSIDLLDL